MLRAGHWPSNVAHISSMHAALSTADKREPKEACGLVGPSTTLQAS